MSLGPTSRRLGETLAILLALSSGGPGASLAQEPGAPQEPEGPAPTGLRMAPSLPAPTPAPEGEDPAELARRARVFARLGEVSLTVGEIEDDLLRRSPFARRPFADRERLVAHARELFRAKLLAHAAAERGYGERSTVRAQVDRHLVSMVVRRQIDAQSGPDQVPVEDARAYFEEHHDRFVRPEQRRASHILLTERDRAVAVLAEIRAGDLRAFRRLAMAESTDTASQQRGGDLGFFDAEGRITGGSEPAIAPEITRAVFALTRQDPFPEEPVTIETPTGTVYSVVRMTGLRAGANPSFEDLEAAVRRRVAVERRDTAYRTFTEELRERFPVRTQNLELLRVIELPPPPMPSHSHRGAERRTEGEEEGSGGDESMAP